MPWAISPEQRGVVAASLTERASRGDDFASDVALALSLVASEPTSPPRKTWLEEWQRFARRRGKRTARSSLRATATSRCSRMPACEPRVAPLTDEGRALLSEAANCPEHPVLSQLLANGTSGRWWWVNQNATYLQERDAGIMWAPLLDKVGRTKHHWETMDEVVRGDQVLHYRGGRIWLPRASSSAPLCSRAEAGGARQRTPGSPTGGLSARSIASLKNPIRARRDPGGTGAERGWTLQSIRGREPGLPVRTQPGIFCSIAQPLSLISLVRTVPAARTPVPTDSQGNRRRVPSHCRGLGARDAVRPR